MDRKKEFVKLLQSVPKYSEQKVFEDFIKLSALSISQAVHFDKKVEEDWLRLQATYSKEEQQIFPQLLAILTCALDEGGFQDFLGEVYMLEKFSSDDKGQFFTPYSVCLLSAQTTFVKSEDEHKIYTAQDPACGGGAMIIALADVMQQKGVNYQKYMYAELTDIAENSVYMSYLQCSLLGIPAKIIHGNSITQEVWQVFETPMVGMQLIEERLHCQKK